MKSINLLPLQRRQELRQELVFRNFLVVIWISAFSFACVIAVQFATRLYLMHEGSVMRSQTEQIKQQVNTTDKAKIKQDVTKVNNLIMDYKNLSASAPKWSKFLEVFAKVPPQGVGINSLTVDSAKRVVTITGYAPTRDLVIQMYNNLVATEGFANVDYPLENVAKPKNVSFHFSFTIQDSLIK